MYLTPNELHEVRLEVHRELADIYRQSMDPIAGSFRYICDVAGITMYTHNPIGRVLKEVVHIPR